MDYMAVDNDSCVPRDPIEFTGPLMSHGSRIGNAADGLEITETVR